MRQTRLYRNGGYEKSGFDDWTTPPKVIRELKEEFGELYDPCPEDWEEGEPDGLKIDWSREHYCFVNPPYSNMKDWAKKCFNEWKKGSGIIMLIPPRTDTRYFHDYIYGNAEFRFFKGRLKFGKGGPPKPAPFPSMLCIFRKKDENNTDQK